ncbi:hypothetical protein VTI74DRAFT_6074 [Chaetomium olivicolor]
MSPQNTQPKPPADAPKPPPECVDIWVRIFNGGPYTALAMLRYILNTAGTTPDKLVSNVNVVGKVTATQIKGQHDITKMREIWAKNTGRCTSFAVKAVDSLESLKNTKYKFEIYDLQGHRVARCRETGVVIDSSSTMPGGAFVLLEGGWARFEKTDASWKFKSSESKFESQGNAQGLVKKSSSPISPAQAMWICLEGVEANVGRSVPTLFRSTDARGVPTYHGMVSWVLSKRAIELVPDISKAKRNRKVIIQWAKDKNMQGTVADLKACVRELEQFVKNYGGAKQWVADGINEFHDQLFSAAVVAWGYPRLDASRMEMV